MNTFGKIAVVGAVVVLGSFVLAALSNRPTTTSNNPSVLAAPTATVGTERTPYRIHLPGVRPYIIQPGGGYTIGVYEYGVGSNNNYPSASYRVTDGYRAKRQVQTENSANYMNAEIAAHRDYGVASNSYQGVWVVQSIGTDGCHVIAGAYANRRVFTVVAYGGCNQARAQARVLFKAVSRVIGRTSRVGIPFTSPFD